MTYYIDVYSQLSEVLLEARHIDPTIEKIKVTFYSRALDAEIDVTFP